MQLGSLYVAVQSVTLATGGLHKPPFCLVAREIGGGGGSPETTKI
jgi:hypothetical protein